MFFYMLVYVYIFYVDICVLLRYLHLNDMEKYEFVPSAVNGADLIIGIFTD